MKKRIVILAILSVVVVLLLIQSSYAWFATVDDTDSITLSSGEVNIEAPLLENYLIDKEFIVPGEELLDNNKVYSITNESSIDIELRFKVFVSSTSGDIEITDDNTNLIISPSNNWVYKNNYWYYETEDTSVITSDVTEINIFQSLKFNGLYYGNSSKLQDYTIKFVFQAKQHKFVTWTNIGEITY